MQLDTDVFPILATQTILQAVGKPSKAVLVAVACGQLAGYARHMRQVSRAGKQPDAAEIVEAMPDDGKRLLLTQVLEWSKKEYPEEMGFVPPWGLIEELCEQLIRAEESA